MPWFTRSRVSMSAVSHRLFASVKRQCSTVLFLAHISLQAPQYPSPLSANVYMVIFLP
jgi:hypothetical protein